MTALVLTLALLLQQPAPTPQRPAEITISVEEYARLKTCEAQMKQTKPTNKFHWVAIGAVAAIAIVAVAKKKQ
jgi:ABC-type uncharacterized transport system permease subunit